ncbi:MAG: stage III sporulation protein AD [Bacillota bacterium]
MELVQIIALCLLSIVLLVLLRKERPELAVLLSLAAGTMVFLLILTRIVAVIQFVTELSVRAGVNMVYLTAVLRVIGIAYITEFGAQVCRDANESAIASKVELAGKVLIILVAVPVIRAVLELLMELIP